jgi:hypothetical protein
MALSVASRFILQPLKTAFQELRDDFRSTRWVRRFGWFSFFVFWCGGLIAAITSIPLSPSYNFIWWPSENTISPCLPNGSFSMEPYLYNPWAISGAFEITLAFGNLTFANAKLIDVIWDVVSA